MTAFAQLHDGDGTGLVRQPGLDGLRGVAVAAVVAFHLGIDEVSGGYLGVSLFFTLSGVLVGSLVIAMLDRRAFSVREFGLRRARRLLPAALTTVAAVGVARLLFEQFSGTPGIDVAAAALDVINWRFVAADVSYAELFAAPSALLHFWSLAIEAQLYLVVAALAVGAALAGTPRRVIGWGALVGTVLSFVMTPLMAAWRGWSIDRIYYGTDTRAGELLAGLALAVLIADGERRRRLLAGERSVALLGALAAVATFVLWSAATPTSAALRFGLLPLTTAFSLALIVAALLPRGPVAASMRWAPLRHLGAISYALYLVHWPVFVVVDPFVGNVAVRRLSALAISVVLAELVTFAVERPVRQRIVAPRLLTGAGVALAIAVVVTTVAPGRTAPADDLLAAIDAADPVPSPPVIDAAPDAPDAERRPIEQRPIGLFGDSIMFSLFLGLDAATEPASFQVSASDFQLGCGLAFSGNLSECDPPVERVRSAVSIAPVEIAVLGSCQWELLDHVLPGDSTVRTIGDPVFDAVLEQRLREINSTLHAGGVERVVWMRCPHFDAQHNGAPLPDDVAASRDPARIERFNALLDELADDDPGVELLCFDTWVNARREDTTIRPDGAHFQFEQPNQGVDEFIRQLDQVLAEEYSCS